MRILLLALEGNEVQVRVVGKYYIRGKLNYVGMYIFALDVLGASLPYLISRIAEIKACRASDGKTHYCITIEKSE